MKLLRSSRNASQRRCRKILGSTSTPVSNGSPAGLSASYQTQSGKRLCKRQRKPCCRKIPFARWTADSKDGFDRIMLACSGPSPYFRSLTSAVFWQNMSVRKCHRPWRTLPAPFYTSRPYANSQRPCEKDGKAGLWDPHKQRAGDACLARFGPCENLWIESQKLAVAARHLPVSIPRQSRGPYFVSRSKQLVRGR